MPPLALSLLCMFLYYPEPAQARSSQIATGIGAVLHEPFVEDGRVGLFLDGRYSQLAAQPRGEVLTSASVSLGRVDRRFIGSIRLERSRNTTGRGSFDYGAGFRASHAHAHLDLLSVGRSVHGRSRTYTVLVDPLSGYLDRSTRQTGLRPGLRLGVEQLLFDGSVCLDLGMEAAALLRGRTGSPFTSREPTGPGAFLAATTGLNVRLGARAEYHVSATYERSQYRSRAHGAEDPLTTLSKSLTLVVGARVAF
jgi:hypothetical protein